MLDALAARGMGALVDHVPNHVAVGQAELNPRWWAMLRDGPDSDAARLFDVDWTVADGKVLLPVLGDPPAQEAVRAAAEPELSVERMAEETRRAYAVALDLRRSGEG